MKMLQNGLTGRVGTTCWHWKSPCVEPFALNLSLRGNVFVLLLFSSFFLPFYHFLSEKDNFALKIPLCTLFALILEEFLSLCPLVFFIFFQHFVLVFLHSICVIVFFSPCKVCSHSIYLRRHFCLPADLQMISHLRLGQKCNGKRSNVEPFVICLFVRVQRTT